MRVLFTRGHSLLSKTICSVTKDPTSHVAIQLKLANRHFVIHSNLLGVHMETLKSFKTKAEIVYALEKFETEDELDHVMNIYTEKEWSWYDIGALLFIGLSLLARRFLKIPLPKSNLWNTSGAFICTEWVEKALKDWNYQDDISMYTPQKIYYVLIGHTNWQIVDVSKEY